MDRGGPSVAIQGAALQGFVPAPVPNVPPEKIKRPTAVVTTAVGLLNFSGGTFGTGAGTNPCNAAPCIATDGPPLSMADYQNSTVSYVQETKVVVYFTDGLMNTIQDTFNCTNNPPGPTLYNYGGYDSGTTVAALVPTSGTQWADIPTNGPPPYGTGSGTCNG